MPTVDRTLSPLHRSVRATLLAATLIMGGGTLATVGGCASSGATPGPVTIDAASPESLLASLKAAAGQSFNRTLGHGDGGVKWQASLNSYGGKKQHGGRR